MMSSERRDALLAEYGEVSSNFRMLTDIRFKLLAFLPLAAGAAAAVLTRGNGTTLTLAFSLFGLVVTIGLVTYNARNARRMRLTARKSSALLDSMMVTSSRYAGNSRAKTLIRLRCALASCLSLGRSRIQ